MNGFSAGDYVTFILEHQQSLLEERRDRVARIVEVSVALLGVAIGWVLTTQTISDWSAGLLLPLAILVISLYSSGSIALNGVWYVVRESEFLKLVEHYYSRYASEVPPAARPVKLGGVLQFSRFNGLWIAIVVLAWIGFAGCWTRLTDLRFTWVLGTYAALALLLPLIIALCGGVLAPYMIEPVAPEPARRG